MEILIIGRTIGRIQLAENSQSERENVFNRFPGLHHRHKHSVKTGTLPGHCRKQKAKPVPLHLQEDVGQELEKLIKPDIWKR